MARKWIIAAAVGIGIYFLLSSTAFLEKKWTIFASISRSFDESEELKYLKEKNQELELQVTNLKQNNPGQTEGFVEAKVFSIYPFSNRSEITISAGEGSGIKTGAAVLWKGFLIGRVKEVRQNASVVTTVFDSSFKLPVRIGEKEADALFVGGLDPRLDLMEKDAVVAPGDTVLSASTDFPYGLGVAKVTKVTEGNIKEASVEPLFEIKDLRNVLVVSH